MSRSHACWFVCVGALALGLVGCGEEPTVQDQDLTEDQVSHADAIQQCNDKKAAGLETALTHPEIGGVLYEWDKCLVSANNGVVSELEESLDAIKSELAGQVLKRFELQRGAVEALCPVIVDASAEPSGLVAGTFLSDCSATHEAALGQLIAGFGGLAEENEVLPSADSMKTEFADCYAVFDAASSDASSQQELAETTFGLAACVQEELTRRALSDEGLVGLTAATFPERSKQDISTAVLAQIEAISKATGNTCDVLTEAGVDGGSFLANTLAGSCRAEALLHVHASMTSIVGPMSGATE